MGQKLYTDKISQLTHSAGNILLASGAILTIGGQQYVTTSQLSVALPALTANTLYMVYAVVSGGVPALVISQNVNSVGPAGQSAWKLVGALYSDGNPSVGFGAFVNITGTPKTGLIAGGATVVTAHTSNPTKGTIIVDRVQWERDGEFVMAYYEYDHSTGSGNAGTGNYFLNVPANFPVNSSNYQFNSDSFSGINGDHNARSHIGTGDITISGANGTCHCQPFDANRFRTWFVEATTGGSAFTGGWGSNAWNYTNANLRFSFTIRYKAQGLSSTALEDL